MTAIEILREPVQQDDKARYHATTHAGAVQSIGTTVGEALDALIAQLPFEEQGSLVVIQQMQPDRFFTESQMRSLQE